MISFNEFILKEYGVNPDYKMLSVDSKSYRQTKKTISVDQSKSEIIPIVLSKKTILSIFNSLDQTTLKHKLGWSVLERIKEQGEKVDGSQEMLVIYVSNEQAQDLKELAHELSGPLAMKVITSVDQGIQTVSKMH